MTPRRLPSGEWVVRDGNGMTVATGFDTEREAREWVDDEPARLVADRPSRSIRMRA